MTNKQIWQTIALDLKRAANFLYYRRENQARFFLEEARALYNMQKEEEKIRITKNFICFDNIPEDLLLASSIISGRI